MEPTPCILEVFSRVPAAERRGCRVRGNYLDAAGRVIDLDSGIAVAAAKISHERKLPLTDAVIVATAGIYNAVLWTLDSDLRDVEGVIFVEKR